MCHAKEVTRFTSDIALILPHVSSLEWIPPSISGCYGSYNNPCEFNVGTVYIIFYFKPKVMGCKYCIFLVYSL